MSQENVEIVRQVFAEASSHADRTGPVVDALDHDSMAVVYEFLDPQIEFHTDPRLPEAGIYRGVEAVRAYWGQFGESFDEFIFEAEDIIGLEDGRVLVLMRLLSRGKDSGARVEARPGWIYTTRDGLVIQIDAFVDRADAFEAVGLSE